MAYVYLIAEEPFEGEILQDWVKIGYSQNPPEWRMNANLKRGNPRYIRVVAAFEYETNDVARNAERAAHMAFEKYRYKKERFQIDWKKVEQWFVGQGAKRRDETCLTEGAVGFASWQSTCGRGG